jgi:hypothetical protein
MTGRELNIFMSKITSQFRYFYLNGKSDFYKVIGDSDMDRYLVKRKIGLFYWHDESDRLDRFHIWDILEH